MFLHHGMVVPRMTLIRLVEKLFEQDDAIADGPRRADPVTERTSRGRDAAEIRRRVTRRWRSGPQPVARGLG